MAKGKPQRNGSGNGTGNAGRGCNNPKPTRQGRNR